MSFLKQQFTNLKEMSPVRSALLFCLLGGIVRLLYGVWFQPWLQAPDHLAFEMLIEDGSMAYDHLIHYPHEGGTLLVGLLGRMVSPFTETGSLAIVAFLLDSIGRFVQLYVISKLFKGRVALAFGIWTVFGTAMIIPWGTISFGLHAVASVFPFVLLYILHQKQNTMRAQVLNGVFLALAFWFSYSNAFLIPVYFLFQWLKHKENRHWGYALLSMTLVLGLHILVRLTADAGFELEETSVASIRGTSFDLSKLKSIKGWIGGWGVPMEQAAAGIQTEIRFVGRIALYLWKALFVLGIFGVLRSVWQKKTPLKVSMHLLTLLFFVTAYSMSPFFFESDRLANYVAYRHLAYILPLLTLMIILGLSMQRFYAATIGVFLCLGIFSTVFLFRQKPSEIQSEQITGWVLGAKLGHQPESLSQMILAAPCNPSKVFQGIGWGMSAALFSKLDENDPPSWEKALDKAASLLPRYPKRFQADLLAGIDYSFSMAVTPPLNVCIEEELLKKLDGIGIRR